MATATTQERGFKSQLNQERPNAKTDESKGFGPATIVGSMEFFLILGAAITVDIIDVLDLTGIGAILVRFIDIPTLGALWLWRILKHQSGPKRDPTLLILSAFLVEISPFGMIPTWTIFVAYTYFQDTKIGKKTIGKVQKVAKIKAKSK